MSTPVPWIPPPPSGGLSGSSSTGFPWPSQGPAFSWWSASWATAGGSGVGSDIWSSSSCTPPPPPASSAYCSFAASGRQPPDPVFFPDPSCSRDPRWAPTDPRLVPLDPRMLQRDTRVSPLTPSPPGPGLYSMFPGTTTTSSALIPMFPATSSTMTPMFPVTSSTLIPMFPVTSSPGLYSSPPGMTGPRLTSSTSMTAAPMFPERPRPLPEVELRPPPPSYAEAMRNSTPMDLPRPPSRSAWAWTRRVTSIWQPVAVVSPQPVVRAPASRDGSGRRAGRQPGLARGPRNPR